MALVYSNNGVDLPVTPEIGEAVDGRVAWELGVLDDGRIVIELPDRALSPGSARTLGRELQRLSAKLGEEP